MVTDGNLVSAECSDLLGGLTAFNCAHGYGVLHMKGYSAKISKGKRHVGPEPTKDQLPFPV